MRGMDEAEARAAVLLAALDHSDPPAPAWTPARRAEVARAVRAMLPPGASAQARVAARTRAALAQLLPASDPASLPARRWLERRSALAPWVAAAAGLALLGGAAIDRLGSLPYVRLVEPAVWGLIAWNLGAYVLLAWSAARGPRRSQHGAWLAALGERLRRHHRALQPPPALSALVPAPAWARFRDEWLAVSRPLHRARLAAVLHVAAAALALGVIAGLYLRGLLVDYAVGWESTFLDAAAMHALVAALYAPAAALAGIALPDAAAIAALRVHPGQAATGAGAAAVVIHLHALSLLLAVVLPRSALAAASAWRARRLGRALPLPDRVLRDAAAEAVTPPPRALSLWRHGDAGPPLEVLAAALGASPPVHAVASGGEDEVEPPGADTLAVLVVAMTATPEAETHGRLLARLRGAGAGAAVLVVDTGAYTRRFEHLPARIAERRAAWAAFAATVRVPLVWADLADASALAGIAAAVVEAATAGAAR